MFPAEYLKLLMWAQLIVYCYVLEITRALNVNILNWIRFVFASIENNPVSIEHINMGSLIFSILDWLISSEQSSS